MNKIRLGGMGYYHPFVYEVDMNTNHKLLIARINDLFSLCDKHCEMKCSDFLDGGELAMIEDEFRTDIIRCFSVVMKMRKER